MDTARHLLVVHHHPLLVEALDVALSGLGFTVHAATTYRIGLGFLDAPGIQWAAVVAHCDMPGEQFDGTLVQVVREKHPTAAIVVISARPRADVGELPDGSVYLPEPFDRAELVAAILSACDPRPIDESVLLV